jgi:ubiquinone/menaquinone biosynthesis C-methylase UbiE
MGDATGSLDAGRVASPASKSGKPRTRPKVLKLHAKQAIPDLLRNRDRILDLLPDSMEEVTVKDAEYHSDSRERWVENNQMLTERNLNAHHRVIDEVTKELDDGAVVLELAGGVGFDADLFLRRTDKVGCYILSELSPSMLEYARQTNRRLAEDPVVLCCLDANEILIGDNQVDIIYTVAALHHFPDLDRSLAEMNRVLKPGGRVVFGIEPNFFWMQTLTTLRPFYRKLFPAKAHSAADEVAEGFVMRDFERIAAVTNWKLEKLMPGWFFTGFAHYGLESVYRALRLSRRLRLPRPVERLFLTADKAVLALPFAKRFAWHYTVVFRKPAAGTRD